MNPPPTLHANIPSKLQWECGLSKAQAALWSLSQEQPLTPAGNIAASGKICCSPDLAALQKALQSVVARHPLLSATFHVRQSDPMQVVDDRQEINLQRESTVGWTGLQLAERIKQESSRVIDLSQGPLLRATVFLGEQESILLLVAHRMVADAWSLGLLMDELSMVYDAEVSGREANLPALEVSYQEYVQHQEQMLAGNRGEQLWQFWQQQLSGEPQILNLATDHPRLRVPDQQEATESCRLDKAMEERLDAVAHRNRSTLSTVLLAAYQALLYRYTSQEDILIGWPAAGRSDSQFESVVGAFANLVVVRVNPSGDLTFAQFLQQVRKAVARAQENQEFPYELLAERLHPNQDSVRAPLVQTTFDFQEETAFGGRLPDAATALELRSIDIVQPLGPAEVAMVIARDDDGLQIRMQYKKHLFEPATITRMLGHYRRVLDAVSSDPGQQLADLPLLSDSERLHLLELNATAREYSAASYLHQLFELQVERTPASVAAIHERQELTYQELNRRANQLASRLRKMGAGPEVRVGICVARSLDMLVGLLGILKSGAAYVPLDPEYPAERLALMLEDSQTPILLTQAALRKGLPPTQAEVFCLDTDWFELEAENPDNVPAGLQPENPAYVIYTSGSTGKPKGVIVTHGAAANFLHAMNDLFGKSAPASWLAVTSMCFDISVLEMFWTLGHGDHVVLHSGMAGMNSRTELLDRKKKHFEFSLFFFAAVDQNQSEHEKYKLLLDSARFGDENGFHAVWTPERHFHPFGGVYPSPSVTSAGVATITKKIGIRAGSVVLPLHDSLRVAEEWAVVDNLSGGRVGVSFASGWNANDFVLAPGTFADRKKHTVAEIETVRSLWRGNSIMRPSGTGKEVEVKIYPKPIQADLPFWLTAAGTPDTFRVAGEIGANLLTHLLGQSLEDLAGKIAAYRTAYREAGHPGKGCVTLMLHTFVGENAEATRSMVRKPFCRYLEQSVDLLRTFGRNIGVDVDSDAFGPQDLEELLQHAFDRYYETSGLMGDQEMCWQTLERLVDADVDEIACLIDFGVEVPDVLNGLTRLAQLKDRWNQLADADEPEWKKAEIDLQCTPSFAATFLEQHAAGAQKPPLRKLLVGGEALSQSLAADLLGIVSDGLFNMYGPTETTVWSSVQQVKSTTGAVPIGRPIANTQMYVLDGRMEMVPAGVSGELFIGGSGLARGYLNRPDLTAERFVPDAFSRHGGRLYRTGDLARWRSDGTLDFLGRADQQVKVRGYRIEPGEIETVLRRHPKVRDAAVTVHEREAGDKQLVAYVIARDNQFPSIAELRAHLQSSLPDYMVPSAFMELAEFPLTPNGKLDRRALPKPVGAPEELKQRYLAPRTPLEEKLCAIWAQVLKVEKVGVEDNFFELGGDSILGIQIVVQAKKAGLSLSPQKLFEQPSVALLAELLQRGEATAAAPVGAKKISDADRQRMQAAIMGKKAPDSPSSLRRGRHPADFPRVPITQSEIDTLAEGRSADANGQTIEDIFPLTALQKGILFQVMNAPESGIYGTQQTYALHGDLNVPAFKQAFQKVIDRYQVLRSSCSFGREGEPFLVVYRQARLPWEVLDWRGIPAAEQQQKLKELMKADRLRGIDLAQEPLMRSVLIHLTNERYQLIWSAHLMILDGWSMAVMVGEVLAYYDAFYEGQTLEIESPVPYGDYIDWLKQQDSSVAETYWRKALQGFTTPTSFGYDGVAQSAPDEEAAHDVELVLKESSVNTLQAFARKHHVTLNTLIQGAWAMHLSRRSGNDDVLFGCVVSGRQVDFPGIESMVGLFINTLPLRVRVARDVPLMTWLKALQNQQNEMRQYESTPLVEIQRWSDVPRGQALFESVLIFQNVPASELTNRERKLRVLDFAILERNNYPLALLVVAGAELSIRMVYDSRLFADATMTQTVNQFHQLLIEMATNPERTLFSFSRSTEAERQSLIGSFNQGLES